VAPRDVTITIRELTSERGRWAIVGRGGQRQVRSGGRAWGQCGGGRGEQRARGKMWGEAKA
jgi:hypothetical protein